MLYRIILEELVSTNLLECYQVLTPKFFYHQTKKLFTIKIQFGGTEKINFFVKSNFEMKSNKIIYSLIVEDIQRVSNQEIQRDLSSKEMKTIIELMAQKINWYEAIADSINEIIYEAVTS